MSLNNLVKRLQDIMRNDAGINGDAQRIEQMVWILFLKVYDAKEEIWEFYDENYTSIIPEELRWRNWAVDHKDGKALTGDALLDFVNGKLFPTLKAIAIDENTPMSQIIVRTAFEDNNNYMKDGILLRQVINVIDEIDFEEYEDRHAFGEIYETILRSLQSAGNSGEFYTPPCGHGLHGADDQAQTRRVYCGLCLWHRRLPNLCTKGAGRPGTERRGQNGLQQLHLRH